VSGPGVKVHVLRSGASTEPLPARPVGGSRRVLKRHAIEDRPDGRPAAGRFISRLWLVITNRTLELTDISWQGDAPSPRWGHRPADNVLYDLLVIALPSHWIVERERIDSFDEYTKRINSSNSDVLAWRSRFFEVSLLSAAVSGRRGDELLRSRGSASTHRRRLGRRRPSRQWSRPWVGRLGRYHLAARSRPRGAKDEATMRRTRAVRLPAIVEMITVGKPPAP
jgi:hypothetical protein